jgi:hypothetical protein
MKCACLFLILAAVCGLWFVTDAAAQVTTATIYGTVLDPSGAIIAGAQVSLKNELTGVSASTTSNGLGEFTFTFLPVGRYSLTISVAGFKEQMQSNMDLAAGQRLRLIYSMEVGQVSEKVTVTAEVPLVEAVSPEQRATLTKVEVNEMPLTKRDWTSLLTVGTGTNIASNAVSLNGLGPGEFRLTVDGTAASGSSESSALNVGSYAYVKAVSLEAIAEVNVSRGIISAEFADTISGNVGLITKSGSNEYHGSLFWNYQARVLNARNAFLTTKPNAVFNQFGGSFGGPILKNKLFYYGVYEGYRDRKFTTFNSNVATAEFRAKAIAAVPGYKQYFDIEPLPNQSYSPTATTGQYIGFGSTTANDDHVDLRGDYYLNNTNLLTVRYTRGRPNSLSPTISASDPRIFQGASEVVTANFTHSHSNFSAETRFGVNHNRNDRGDGIYTLGIPTVGGIGFGSDNSEVLNMRGTGWSIEEVLAFNRGRHSIKTGGLFQYQNQTRENYAVPALSYSSVNDFLANIPSGVAITFGTKEYLDTLWMAGFFVQDDFKIRSNLVLNLGLRYDYNSVPRERDGRLYNRDEPFGYGPLRPADSVYEADYNNVSPRLGFAWTLDSSGKTVIRGGSGILYMRHPIRTTLQLVRNGVDQPFRVSYSRAEALALGLKYPVIDADVQKLNSSSSAPWADPTINPNFPDAYAIQWTLSLQRQLTNSLAFETSYVGNHGNKLLFTRYMDRVDRVTGLRPVAGFAEFRHFDTSESSHYNGWQSSLRKRLSRNLLLNLYYTYSNNISFLNGDVWTDQDAPQDLDNIAANRGPTSFDIRHRFVSDFMCELPFARLLNADSRPRKLLLDGWQFAGIFQALSGSPFNAEMPNAFRNQRIDYVGGSAYVYDESNPLLYLNRSAFAAIPIIAKSGASARPGTLGRMALRMPGYWNLDLALSKKLLLSEKVSMQIRADMFNAFNHTSFSGINSNITQANFGRFTASRDARIIQINARLSF